MSLSRDPSEYHPSEHATVRKRTRNIEWEWVSNAIANGRIHPGLDENRRVFTDWVESRRGVLKVVVETTTGTIVTVAWYADEKN